MMVDPDRSAAAALGLKLVWSFRVIALVLENTVGAQRSVELVVEARACSPLHMVCPGSVLLRSPSYEFHSKRTR